MTETNDTIGADDADVSTTTGQHTTTSTVVHVAPELVGVDEMNERDEEFETADLENSIERMGLVEPPLVREADDDSDFEYEAVVGQRRIAAAQNVNAAEDTDNVGDVPVIVMDWSDEDALTASITENIDVFNEDVSMTDRAQALQQMWEMMGGEGMPVQSHLGAKLGVPRETVRQWLEPLHDGWKDSTVDPSTDDEPSDAVASLGERKLAEIRRMTDGGEEAESVAQAVADAGLTQEEVKDMRSLVEDEGYAHDAAIDQLTPDDENGDGDDAAESIEATVKFGDQTSNAVESYATDHDTEPAIVIMDAVEWFLQEEGYLDS